MQSSLIIQILEFGFGVAALIILHEFGHYLVARWMGIEVEEFGIGFPPRIVKLFEAGGTEFTLNWIPLGGFVRPKGENDPDVAGGLAAANPWKRLAVLFAGPFMNIATGIILGILFFYTIGEPILNRVLILDVASDSPAQAAGLLKGDQILQVDGIEVDSIEKAAELIQERQGQETELLVARDGQTLTTTLTPRVNPPANQGAIGIYMGNPSQPVTWGTAIERGSNLAYQNAHAILTLPLRLVQGDTQPGEERLVGFKGMFDIYQQIPSPLYFFMAISISLGVLNLFPIPALDGGRILLTLPEIVLRRRIPPQYENMIHLVGFTLLLILIIYINVQDFVNPLQIP